MTSSTKPCSRRAFLSGAATSTGGLTPGMRAFGGRRPQANDMLDVAIVGAGGRGGDDTADLLPPGR